MALVRVAVVAVVAGGDSSPPERPLIRVTCSPGPPAQPSPAQPSRHQRSPDLDKFPSCLPPPRSFADTNFGDQTRNNRISAPKLSTRRLFRDPLTLAGVWQAIGTLTLRPPPPWSPLFREDISWCQWVKEACVVWAITQSLGSKYCLQRPGCAGLGWAGLGGQAAKTGATELISRGVNKISWKFSQY